MARGDIELDEMVFQAVIRNLHEIAESTQRLPDDLKQRFPGIPWVEIARFRNIAVHNYLGDAIDAAMIRDIVDSDLPDLRSAVADMLDSGRG